MKRIVGVAAAAMVVVLCAAQTSAPPPAIREFDATMLEALGQQIYYQDGEAAQATDILFAQKKPSDLSSEGLRGWIVDAAPAQNTVRFIRQGDAGLEAAYDIVFAAGAAPHLLIPENRALTDEEKSQFAARLLVLKNVERPCSDHYNTVALKDPEHDDWLVWALAATTDPKKLFIGGHYRFTVSKDGRDVIQRDALSRGCLTMAMPENAKERKVVAQASIQLVSNIPVETNVWLNLQSKIPMIVITPDRVEWTVSDGKIRKSGSLPVNPPERSAEK
jgi:hypothetical protein